LKASTRSVQLGEAVGRSVMYVPTAGCWRNSAFAHIGSYEKSDERHRHRGQDRPPQPDPNYRAMAGTDDALCWREAGLTARFTASKALEGIAGVKFQSVMTPIEDEASPIRSSVGEDGIIERPLSIHLRMLDGVEGG